jgi:hypothetical protein
VPADTAGFERRVDELTSMYLRLLGLDTARRPASRGGRR